MDLTLFTLMSEAVKLRKPKPWKHSEPITTGELKKMRIEFWDTASFYGGKKVIWDTLKAASEERDLHKAQLFLDTAGIIREGENLSVCYDERGAKYELPKYLFSTPSNLVKVEEEKKQQKGGACTCFHT